jgi:hypothetical protein
MIQNDNTSRTISISTRVCVCCGIFFMCLGIGIYIKEHFEQREYVETSCYVRKSRIGSFLCRRPHYYICYYPVWEVEYSSNGTRNATITERQENVRETYLVASDRRESFLVSRRTDKDAAKIYFLFRLV